VTTMTAPAMMTATPTATPIGPLESAPADNGQSIPQRRFKKEVVRVGRYAKMSAGEDFQITRAHLDNWITQFGRMKANGVRVPIPDQHANHGSATRNMGWVDSLWIEGDTLWMACTIIGEDAVNAVARSDVSLQSPPRLVDGKGNVYMQPIEHVALCTNPVVPGLGDFIPLSLSRAARTTAIVKDALRRRWAAAAAAQRAGQK